MKVDITDLLIVFDEMITPLTDEELGVYWFRILRRDKLTVTISFFIYERYVEVLIYSSGISIASIDMKNCSEIRVLEREKKTLEIIHEDTKSRCFLALTGDTIVEYSE